MLFPTLKDDLEAIPEHVNRIDRILQHPRISALLQFRSNVQTSFKVDISTDQYKRKDDAYLTEDHDLRDFPNWLTRFYLSNNLWAEVKTGWFTQDL